MTTSDNSLRSRPWPWVLLACAALLSLGPVYETNDDPAMALLLSGQLEGQVFDPLYLGRPFSAVLAQLYRWFPAVPWYGLVLESCALAAVLLWAGLVICRTADSRGRRAALAGLLLPCGYFLLRLNFLSTALALFGASLAWVWALHEESRPVLLRHAWLGVAMGLAYVIRPSLRWLMVFLALPCLARLVRRGDFKRLLVVALPGLLLFAVTAGADRLSLRDPARRARVDFNWTRSSLVDEARTPSPEALAAAGWSETDYQVAVRQWLHDETIFGVERMRAFVANAVPCGRLTHAVANIKAHLSNRFHLLAVLNTLAFLVCFLAAGRGPRQGGSRLPALLLWGYYAGGVLLLMAIRFPPRVFVPLYLYLAALVLPRPSVAEPGRRLGALLRTAAAVGAVCCGVFAVAHFCRDGREGIRRLQARRAELTRRVPALGADRIVVLNGALETSYTPVFRNPTPPAGVRVVPGGWLMGSSVYPFFLRQAGFDSGRAMVLALVTQGRGIFVTAPGAEAGLLLRHFNEHYAEGGRLVMEPADLPADGDVLHLLRVVRQGDR